MTNLHRAFNPGDQLLHARFGIGEVILDRGTTVVAQFRDGIQASEKTELERVFTPFQAIDGPDWHGPLNVITRCQAEAIQSVNDVWGVFSRSRIALLPHQLWVCRQVLRNWPARWLVADDVGLGKTIEAGLILWPLISRGTARRILVLCPASLVDQWTYRLLEMFDIRTTRYSPEADTPRADFWNTHEQVVASLQTLRSNNRDRRARMLAAEPWDLLIVDEAHHLNADEDRGPTLGYKLVDELVSQRRVSSMIFFTGTPHRGKDFGFFSLMHLLRPDLFDPRQPIRPQLPLLREAMIRNNKQNVTDMRGKRLFQPPQVSPETYQYSPAEARFYEMLTEFILTGKAYASSLSTSDRRMVMLVLIALQKLASSSVAAIRRALQRRLERLVTARTQATRVLREQQDLRQLLTQYEELETEGEGDTTSRVEEEVASALIRLMGDEEPRLRELLAVAEDIREETKVNKILRILDDQFVGRAVLFFTEYKATQSLLMSALIQRYGDGCVTFINGDDMAEEVIGPGGRPRTLRVSREGAAELFNSGKVRFLVSTEAGGEGIDLQERCYSLIHVDLPWNPMRLHQRVGRLNRYGQTQRVEVIQLRNPDTVEARIWDKLNEKIDRIMAALDQVMDEPEDLLQLVLGMTSSSLFRELFAEADSVPKERLSEWFDERTARFGGQDALDTVRELTGYAAQFDFQQASSHIPDIDLSALAPFLKTMLWLNGRQVRVDAEGISFRTPDAWLTDPGVRTSYDRLVFDRQGGHRDIAQRLVGVGHRALDQALRQARTSTDSVATLPATLLRNPLVLFSITDTVTTEAGLVRSVIICVELRVGDGDAPLVLRDWETLERLNALAEGRGFRRARTSTPPANFTAVREGVEIARRVVEERLASLDLPFRLPTASLLAILWPGESVVGSSSHGEPGENEDR